MASPDKIGHADLIPSDPKTRLQLIIDEAWKIFASYLVNEKHSVTKEAPFQHHFANVINTVGSLYCLRRNEHFRTDLEAKHENLNGRTKYIDIVCCITSGTEAVASCGIELKFKTQQQGAQDHGRIDAYVDIEALEHAARRDHDFGRFFMITDSQTYLNLPRKTEDSAGSVFATYNGYRTSVGKTLNCASKGREDVKITLSNEYLFDWKAAGSWYLLDLHIDGSTQVLDAKAS